MDHINRHTEESSLSCLKFGLKIDLNVSKYDLRSGMGQTPSKVLKSKPFPSQNGLSPSPSLLKSLKWAEKG